MTQEITGDELASMIEVMNKATKETLEANATSVKVLKEHLASLEQRILEGGGGKAVTQKSWGEQFVENDAVKAFSAETTHPGRCRIEMKTTLTSATGSGGDLWAPSRDAVSPMPKRRLTIRNILPVIQVSTGSVEYPRQTTRTNNAGMVAEGADKPESALAFELVTASVKTIAHWLPASRQILDDSPQLRGIIDQELLYGLALKEESQILSGDNTGQNLYGLIPQATAFSAPVNIVDVNKIDVIGLAALQSGLAEFPADGIVVHPSDLMEMRLLKDAEGRYILGDPTNDVTPNLFGLPVVATQAMTVKKFLVGGFQAAATLYDRWAPRVEVSTEHSDFFVKNLVAILAEERIALAVKQAGALIYGDFDAALGV